MTPRIPLANAATTTYGNADARVAVPDAGELAPDIAAARTRSQRSTFALSTINDPVLVEMVRLRNARFQDCHFCQSTRSPAARAAGADEDLYAAIDSYESTTLLDQRQKAALRFADAFLTRPSETPTAVYAGAAEHFSSVQLVELALRLVAYSSDKVMVALKLDMEQPLTRDELERPLPASSPNGDDRAGT